MTRSSWRRSGAVRRVRAQHAGPWAQLLWCGAVVVQLVATGTASASPPRAPVVLELFSSEGCSSCPPADELLAQLAAAGEVGGAPLIALELHVDSWDYLGWRDPFSSAELTARQEHYAGWLHRRSYTPQLVVDGQADVMGSNRARVTAAIAAAAQQKSPATVVLRRQGDQLAVEASGLTPGATVLLAITEQGLTTRVLRGENAGKTLHHGPVVRALRPLAVGSGDRYAATVPLQLAGAWHTAALHAVVLVQAADGHILGAGTLPLSEPRETSLRGAVPNSQGPNSR